MLSSYAAGRTTSWVINLGLEITIVAIFEGAILSATARVLRNPRYDMLPTTAPSQQRHAAAAERWMDCSGLLAALEDSLEAAPIDTRGALLHGVVISGGERWATPHMSPAVDGDPVEHVFSPAVRQH
eukprot:COSAG01_NODE_7863_length_3021_cov_1.688227_2_plen_127_part_00